jgi:hypothetical protein
MSTEKKIKKLLEELQGGKIDREQMRQLEEYVQQYPQYKQFIKLHKLLTQGELVVPEPESEQFSRMRANVMREIRAEGEKQPGWMEKMITNFRTYAMKPEMAVAALTLIIGILLGRALPPDQASLASDLMKQINMLASENKKLEDVRKSPYTYSNVSFREVNGEKIALSFDVTTHLDLVSKKEDPLVRDIIAQSLINPSNVGTDLKAISYTEGMDDRKLKEALVYSMLHAPVMAVRLKSMSNLLKYENDPFVQNAFIKVLRDEESVKMRLLAADYLINNQIPADSLQKALSESEIMQNPAVMLKVSNYAEQK